MNNKHLKQQSGLSLVEIMIATLVGVFLMAGVIQIFISSKETYRTQEGLSRLQENGRFAIEFLAREVRMAGFGGCNSRNATLTNTLNGNSGSWELNFDQPLDGYDDIASGDTSFTQEDAFTVGTDAITILRADPNNACSISSHNPSAATIHCAANHEFKQGEILVASDCSHAAVFQMNNVNNNNTIAVVNHNTGSATNPGNCTKGLGWPLLCTTNGNAYSFEGGKIQRMLATGFYIAEGAGGQPALFREEFRSGSEIMAGGARTTAVELVEGIENMQILYGADTDDDGTANLYVPASDFVSSPLTPNMNQVVSVRISILARSLTDNLTSAPIPYTYNGATTTPADNRLRKVFTSTFSVRNRLD